MIVFTHTKDLAKAISNKVDKYRTLNLSSRYPCQYDISYLMTNLSNIRMPNMKVDEFVYSVEFDMQFATGLQIENQMFNCLMNIMIPDHNGECVIIMVDRDKYRDAVMESLIKYIQQFYGKRCWIVEDIDDIENIEDSNYSPNGITAIDKDIEKFEELRSKGIVSAILNEESKERS